MQYVVDCLGVYTWLYGSKPIGSYFQCIHTPVSMHKPELKRLTARKKAFKTGRIHVKKNRVQYTTEIPPKKLWKPSLAYEWAGAIAGRHTLKVLRTCAISLFDVFFTLGAYVRIKKYSVLLSWVILSRDGERDTSVMSERGEGGNGPSPS